MPPVGQVSIVEKPQAPAASPDLMVERVTAVDLQGFSQVSVSTDRACIVVIYGPELGKRASLGQAAFEIGRSSKSDLPIDQESISRHHARMTWDGQSHVIEDLGSTNGTFVNDERVTRRQLRSGDQIKLGRSILKYMAGDNIEANYHEEIYRLMTMDALTQTHNRRYFNEALEREHNRSLRYRRALSLILFDIDHFKKINDTYGHQIGDVVLKSLAKRLAGCVRKSDRVFRYGGEEFSILLPHTGLAKAGKLAGRIRFEVEQTDFIAGLKITVSIGISEHRDGLTPTGLVEQADRGLYLAKERGRNRVEAMGGLV